MEMILGAMILALWVKTGAAVLADTVTTLRASKAGEWGLIDRQRDRKAAALKSRREAMGKAWQNTRARRSKKAGGDGTYRPGMAAYLGDVYHGLWEDRLEARQAKRANRPPLGPDGKRPITARVDAAMEAKVRQRRTARESLARAGRVLWEPVGETRQATDDRPASPAGGGRGHVECPLCHASLTFEYGGWSHPQGSTCALGVPLGERRPDGGHHVPAPVAEAATGMYRQNRAEGRSGALGETQTARDLAGQFGDQHPQHVYEQAAADATHTLPPNSGPWMPAHDDLARAALDALADSDPNGQRWAGAMAAARQAVQRQFPRMHPEAVAEAVTRADQAPGCAECGQRRGVTPLCEHRQARADRLRAATRPKGRPAAAWAPPTSSEVQRMRNELYGKCAYRDPVTGEWCDNPFDGTNPHCHEHRTTATLAASEPGNPPADQGETMTDIHEINTNEDARRAFTDLAAAAKEASDALAMLEAARAKMAAAAAGTADGMSGKKFDVAATAAAGEAAEVIAVSTLADWSEKIDNVTAAAEAGLRALDKYRDSENLVASEDIDPTTLAATSS